jgi:hypothetical protein
MRDGTRQLERVSTDPGKEVSKSIFVVAQGMGGVEIYECSNLREDCLEQNNNLSPT